MRAGLRRICAYPGLREFKNSQLLARLVRGVALVAESFEVREGQPLKDGIGFCGTRLKGEGRFKGNMLQIRKKTCWQGFPEMASRPGRRRKAGMKFQKSGAAVFRTIAAGLVHRFFLF